MSGVDVGSGDSVGVNEGASDGESVGDELGSGDADGCGVVGSTEAHGDEVVGARDSPLGIATGDGVGGSVDVAPMEAEHPTRRRTVRPAAMRSPKPSFISLSWPVLLLASQSSFRFSCAALGAFRPEVHRAGAFPSSARWTGCQT